MPNEVDFLYWPTFWKYGLHQLGGISSVIQLVQAHAV